MNLSPITFGVILPLNPRDKNSINSRINPVAIDESRNYKVPIIKISLDSGASESVVCKDVLYYISEFVRIK